jgi:hypothetical protein
LVKVVDDAVTLQSFCPCELNLVTELEVCRRISLPTTPPESIADPTFVFKVTAVPNPPPRPMSTTDVNELSQSNPWRIPTKLDDDLEYQLRLDADRLQDTTKHVFANEGDGALKPVIVGFVDMPPLPAIQIISLGAIHTEGLPFMFDKISAFESALVIEFITITMGDALKLVVVPIASV